MRRTDAAASDLVSTLLLVLVVVALSSVLAVAVVGTISRPVASDASLALDTVSAGDTILSVELRNGEPLAVANLHALLSRNGSAPALVAFAPASGSVAAGQAINVTLAPPAAPGEALSVTLVRLDTNSLLASLSARVAGASSPYARATLGATLTPATLPADGASSALVAVRVQAPQGVLGVASVEVDMTSLAQAANATAMPLALHDLGADGDVLGGDGVWSGALLVPRGTPLGVYALPINATDVSGALIGNGTLLVAVSASTEATCVSCPATAGIGAVEGTRLYAATSANASVLRVRNITWDVTNPAGLSNDVIELRILGGGRSWVARIDLDYLNNVPVAKALTLMTATAQTVYKPRNASLPLANLDLDLLNPIGSLQWAYLSGAADPAARYANAGLVGTPILSVGEMRDDVGKGAPTAIYSADVIIR